MEDGGAARGSRSIAVRIRSWASLLVIGAVLLLAGGWMVRQAAWLATEFWDEAQATTFDPHPGVVVIAPDCPDPGYRQFAACTGAFEGKAGTLRIARVKLVAGQGHRSGERVEAKVSGPGADTAYAIGTLWWVGGFVVALFVLTVGLGLLAPVLLVLGYAAGAVLRRPLRARRAGATSR